MSIMIDLIMVLVCDLPNNDHHKSKREENQTSSEGAHLFILLLGPIAWSWKGKYIHKNRQAKPNLYWTCANNCSQFCLH
eukprot:5990256-Amphidinium_carterae.2